MSPRQGGNEALMERLQGGDRRAFELFYDGLAIRAFGMARAVCRDAGRAEEVVQDAFTAVWRNRSSYDSSKGSVESWVFRIVHNRAVDSLRKEMPHTTRRTAEELLDNIEAPGSVADGLVNRTEAQAVRNSVKDLPEAQREVILLAFFGGLTHREIAQRLTLPSGTVKGRMRLGLAKLRRNFDV